MTSLTEGINRVEIARLLENETAYAVIHAMLPSHAERILNGKSDSFGKYIGYQRITDSLGTCKRFMIYVSRESKQIVADAEIAHLSFETTNEIVKRLGNRFFLTSVELDSYSRGRRRPLLVFELRNVRRYSNPISLRKSITMAGQIVSKNEFDRLALISNSVPLSDANPIEGMR